MNPKKIKESLRGISEKFQALVEMFKQYHTLKILVPKYLNYNKCIMQLVIWKGVQWIEYSEKDDNSSMN